MSDRTKDLVSRLRTGSCGDGSIHVEAAREIERLQREIKVSKAESARYRKAYIELEARVIPTNNA